MTNIRGSWGRAWLCACLGAIISCAGVPAQAQAGGVPTTAAYAKALMAVQSALVRQSVLLQNAPPAMRDSIPVERLAHQALDRFAIAVGPDGAVQPVDSRLLEASLHRAASVGNAHARADAYGLASRQVGELRAFLSGGGASHAPQSPQASVRAVLGRGEFGSDPLPPPSLWERFSAWLDRLFSRHRRASAPTGSISPVFIKTLLIVVAAGAFALLVAVLVQYLRQRVRPPAALALSEEEEALVEARDADSLRALAEEQGRQGEWRRAFRLTYLAALVALDTHGSLRFDRSKTNWEYLRVLRAAGQSETYAALMPFTREFDRIWYGGAQAESRDYAYAVAQYQSLTQAQAGLPAAPTSAAAA